jgi:hypothetical protein
MFWIIILSILLFTFRDEIVSRFVNDEDYKKIVKLKLVIGIVVLLVISGLVYYCVRNTQVITLEDAEQIVVSESQTPVVANDIVVPDGYELIPLKVVDACFVCKDCGKQKSKPGLHNPDRKVITFQNGRKVTFWKDSQDYKNWVSVGKGDICSYIRQVDEQGVLVKDMLLPVAPEFVCFDTEKDIVSYRN